MDSDSADTESGNEYNLNTGQIAYVSSDEESTGDFRKGNIGIILEEEHNEARNSDNIDNSSSDTQQGEIVGATIEQCTDIEYQIEHLQLVEEADDVSSHGDDSSAVASDSEVDNCDIVQGSCSDSVEQISGVDNDIRSCEYDDDSFESDQSEIVDETIECDIVKEDIKCNDELSPISVSLKPNQDTSANDQTRCNSVISGEKQVDESSVFRLGEDENQSAVNDAIDKQTTQFPRELTTDVCARNGSNDTIDHNLKRGNFESNRVIDKENIGLQENGIVQESMINQKDTNKIDSDVYDVLNQKNDSGLHGVKPDMSIKYDHVTTGVDLTVNGDQVTSITVSVCGAHSPLTVRTESPSGGINVNIMERNGTDDVTLCQNEKSEWVSDVNKDQDFEINCEKYATSNERPVKDSVKNSQSCIDVKNTLSYSRYSERVSSRCEMKLPDKKNSLPENPVETFYDDVISLTSKNDDVKNEQTSNYSPTRTYSVDSLLCQQNSGNESWSTFDEDRSLSPSSTEYLNYSNVSLFCHRGGTRVEQYMKGSVTHAKYQHTGSDKEKLFGGVIDLHGAWFCPFTQQLWIYLLEKGIRFDFIPFDPYSNCDWVSISQKGRQPFITHNFQNVHGAMNCIQYLDEINSKISPPNNHQRVFNYQFWSSFIESRIAEPMYTLMLTIDVIERRTARQELLENIRSLTEAMDETGPFFLGSEFGILDTLLTPFATRLASLHLTRNFWLPNCSPFNRFHIWLNAVSQRRSVRQTAPNPNNVLQANISHVRHNKLMP